MVRNAALVLVAAIAGCVAAEAPRDAPDHRELGRISAPIRVATEFPFRAAANGFVARTASYRAAIDKDSVEIASAGDSVTPASVLRLESTGVRRGGQEIEHASVLAPPAPVGNAGLSWDHGSYVSAFEATDLGLEQSWRFRERPDGSGAIEIELTMEGTWRVEETSTGLHLRKDGEKIGFRYGLATWIDATGERTSLSPTWSTGSIRILVPQDLVDRSTYPVVLDPLISPEIGVDEPVPALLLAPNASSNASRTNSAMGRDSFLVTWLDVFAAHYDVVAARVRDADGEVLDPTGFLVDSLPFGSETSPGTGMAFDGQGTFLVAYEAATSTGSAILARRVRESDGAVIDARPIRIASSTSLLANPNVAFAGGVYLVAWTEGGGSQTTSWMRRVDSSGAMLDAAPSTVGPSIERGGAPRLASARDLFLVSHIDSFGLISQRVRASDGAILDNPAIAIGLASDARATADEFSFLLAFKTYPDDGLAVRRIGASTATLSPTVTIWPTGLSAALHDVAATASGYMAVWNAPTGDNRILGERLAEDLTLLDGPPGAPGITLVSDAQNMPLFPRLAAGRVSNLLTFQIGREIYASRRDRSTGGELGTRMQLSLAENAQALPEVGFAGTTETYLVSWLDYRHCRTVSDPPALYAARVRASDSSVLDTTGIEIVPQVGADYPQRVASNGSDFLVAWTSTASQILAARVRASDGALLDAPPIVIADDHLAFSLAFDGSNYVALVPYAMGYTIHRVNALSGQQSVLQSAQTPDFYPMHALACGAPGDCMVIGAKILPDASARIGALRIDASTGMPISGVSTTLSEPRPSRPGSAPGWEGRGGPRITASGTEYLVVYSQEDDILARRVGFDAAALDQHPIEVAADPSSVERVPSVAFTGASFWVFWATDRASPGVSRMFEVYGTRVSTSGVVLGGSPTARGIRIAATAPTSFLHSLIPAAASDGNGKVLVAYNHLSPHPPTKVDRLELVTLTDQPGPRLSGELCNTSTDCMSGFCVDAVCCESACGGGVAGDCSVCSAAAGSSADGVCELLPQCGDASVMDAGPPAPDASDSLDGAALDAIDATPRDQGTLSADSTVRADAVGAEGSMAPDAGEITEVDDGGCGCRSTHAQRPGGALGLAGIVVGLAAIARRRSRAAPSQKNHPRSGPPGSR